MSSTFSPASLSPFVRRVLAVSALGVGLLGAAACGSTVDQTETATTPASTAQAEHAGPGMAFIEAARGLNLRPDQSQTVESIRASLQEQAAPVQAARAKLGAALAAQVRAGKIDRAALQPLMDQIKTAAGAQKPAFQQAVQQIHDTLDASQRQALVASMQAKVQGGAANHRGMMKAHMDQIAAELSLTDDQRAAIHAQLKSAYLERSDSMRAEHGQMKARMETLATAFQSDTFDAKALAVGEHGGQMANHFAGMRGAFLEAAVPILTPAQREILATKIQAHTGADEAVEE